MINFTEFEKKVKEIPFCNAWGWENQTNITYSHHGIKWSLYADKVSKKFIGGTTNIFLMSEQTLESIKALGFDNESLKTVLKKSCDYEQERQNKLIGGL